jgi:hypothetical protein
METQDFFGILVNAILFFLAYKIGQMSILLKLGQENRSQIQKQLEQVRLTSQRPVITVEEINGIYYAYDGNDFLAQGETADEVGRSIAQRYPNKYKLAEVKIKN